MSWPAGDESPDTASRVSPSEHNGGMPFSYDHDALLKLVRESDGLKQPAGEGSERVAALVREVDATHAGRPAAEVGAELHRKFEVNGVTPEEPGFTEVVTAIARGELTG